MKREINKTPQGYMYAVVSKEDCYSWGGFAVCDLCGENFEKGYLTFVLNNCVCEKCFNEWLQRAKTYEEDLRLQDECAEKWFEYHFRKLDN